jgi:catechol 2,3-dioxygenase-like lactoylglutathione lyase family enzyme
VDFLHVQLDSPASLLPALRDFYGDVLGCSLLEEGPDLVAIEVGATRLDFRASDAEPFYHFALHAPGNRFDAALEWLRERVPLLPQRDSDEVVFDFASWSAYACYFHDPAGNVAELIAHRGLGENDENGPFSAGELLGLSELCLVGPPGPLAEALTPLGLELWDGTVEQEGMLGFVGERGRTLILCPPGRGWLPTGRPAEPHPVEALLSGPPAGEVLAGGVRIARTGS